MSCASVYVRQLSSRSSMRRSRNSRRPGTGMVKFDAEVGSNYDGSIFMRCVE
ncbi:hypothetical protein QFZ98_008236 [Paraburkholderia youngii]